MKAEKQENLMSNKISPRVEELADLPVTDEQSHQAKGGGDIVPTDQFSLNFAAIKFDPRK